MMARPFRRFVFAGIGLALLICLPAWRCPAGWNFEFTPVQRGQVPLLVLPLEPGEPFTIHYYHSVENAPIWETHSLDPSGRIFIEEERYLKFGAGMGKMPGWGAWSDADLTRSSKTCTCPPAILSCASAAPA
jgi:hypothetical protein